MWWLVSRGCFPHFHGVHSLSNGRRIIDGESRGRTGAPLWACGISIGSASSRGDFVGGTLCSGGFSYRRREIALLPTSRYSAGRTHSGRFSAHSVDEGSGGCACGEGIAAARLDSTLTAAEVAEVYESMVNGTLKLLYVAPERFVSETFVARIKRAKIGLLAIDEAHCISEWGHNFRPEYLRLAALAKNSESSVCLLSRPQLRRRWSRKSALVFGSRRRTAFRHPFFGGIWPCTSPLFRPTSGFRF